MRLRRKKWIIAGAIFMVLAVTLLLAYLLLLPSLEKDHIAAGSLERKFHYYIPPRISRPGVVFLFHGSGMTVNRLRLMSSRYFEKLAGSFGNMIIVYPVAYGGIWNDCRRTGAGQGVAINEAEYIRAVISRLGSRYSIDTGRIFAAGYSDGGQLCFRLAMEEPELFKGVAVAGASLPAPENMVCRPRGLPVSMMIIQGTADPLNPYHGGRSRGYDGSSRGAVVSSESTVAYWQQLAGPVVTRRHIYPGKKAGDSSTIERMDMENPVTGKKISFIRVLHGGHHIPGPGFGFRPSRLGNLNRELHAPAEIWGFFAGLN